MVAQDRYCIEVLTQISAAQAAPERSLSSSVRRFVFEFSERLRPPLAC